MRLRRTIAGLIAAAIAAVVVVPAAMAQELPALDRSSPLFRFGEAGAQINRTIKGATIGSIRLRPTRFVVPFQPRLRQPLTAVVHSAAPVGLPPGIAVRSFFDRRGQFRGSESLTTVLNLRRKSPAIVEKLLIGCQQRVVGPAPLPPNFDLNEVWDAVSDFLPVEEIKEFNLYAVNYVVGRGPAQLVVIVNIWGPENPLGMPDDLLAAAKNRIRFVYYINRKTWEADNLL